MYRIVICSSFFVTLALLFYSGCSSPSATSPGQIVFPDSNVSYSKHLQPLFNLTCTSSGCHTESTPAAGYVDLTPFRSYSELFLRGDVSPKNSDGSVLVKKIERTLTHPAAGVTELNDNQKKGIRRWIDEGANQN